MLSRLCTEVVFLRSHSQFPASLDVSDILPTYGEYPTLGLAGNMVYDIIPIVPSSVGQVAVNATRFNSECGLLPQLSQTNFSGLQTNDVVQVSTEAQPPYYYEFASETSGGLVSFISMLSS